MRKNNLFVAFLLIAILTGVSTARADEIADKEAQFKALDGHRDCKSLQNQYGLILDLQVLREHKARDLSVEIKADSEKLLANIPNVAEQFIKLDDMIRASKAAETQQQVDQDTKALYQEFVVQKKAAEIIAAAKSFFAKNPDFFPAPMDDFISATNSPALHGPTAYYMFPHQWCHENSNDVSSVEKSQCYKSAMAKIVTATPKQLFEIVLQGKANEQVMRVQGERARIERAVNGVYAAYLFCRNTTTGENFEKICGVEHSASGPLANKPCGDLSQDFVDNFIPLSQECNRNLEIHENEHELTSLKSRQNQLGEMLKNIDQVLRDNSAGSCITPKS